MTQSNAALVALAKELRVKKDRKDTLEAELTALEKDLKKLTTETIPSMMDDMAYCKKEDEARFHDWLREQGDGDLIRSYVFPATLKAYAKEQIEADIELPDYLNAAKVPVARLRRK